MNAGKVRARNDRREVLKIRAEYNASRDRVYRNVNSFLNLYTKT